MNILPTGAVDLVSMPFGSHLYGTDTPASDHDFKGVFMPSRRDVLLGTIPRTVQSSTGDPHAKNRPGDVDIEWYSLHYFLKLACEGQTVAIDMLHAPLAMLVEPSEEWAYLHEHRQEFHTRNLQAFVGYCRRQAAKYGVKGSRLNAVRSVIAILEAVPDKSVRLGTLLPSIPIDEHVQHVVDTQTGKHFLEVCGRKLETSASVETTLIPLRRFEANYGTRAEQAASNQGIDWKAVSHALRAAYELRAIYTAGDIIFPLPEASYLKRVKAGGLDYLGVVAPELERAIDEVEQLAAASSLPEKANVPRWNDWLQAAVEKRLWR